MSLARTGIKEDIDKYEGDLQRIKNKVLERNLKEKKEFESLMEDA